MSAISAVHGNGNRGQGNITTNKGNPSGGLRRTVLNTTGRSTLTSLRPKAVEKQIGIPAVHRPIGIQPVGRTVGGVSKSLIPKDELASKTTPNSTPAATGSSASTRLPQSPPAATGSSGSTRLPHSSTPAAPGSSPTGLHSHSTSDAHVCIHPSTAFTKDPITTALRECDLGPTLKGLRTRYDRAPPYKQGTPERSLWEKQGQQFRGIDAKLAAHTKLTEKSQGFLPEYSPRGVPQAPYAGRGPPAPNTGRVGINGPNSAVSPPHRASNGIRGCAGSDCPFNTSNMPCQGLDLSAGNRNGECGTGSGDSERGIRVGECGMARKFPRVFSIFGVRRRLVVVSQTNDPRHRGRESPTIAPFQCTF